MKKTVCFSVVCVVIALIWVSSSDAIMIGFEPSAQSVAVGGSVDVDIIISGLEEGGLDEIVSAYNLVIGYDEAVLSVADVAFGPFLGDSFQYWDPDYNPGELFISELSLSPDDALAALQSDSFIMATVSFDALAGGSSDLLFRDYIQFGTNYGIDVKGRAIDFIPQILDLSAGSGSTTVTGSPTPVPEPATILLLLPGLLLSGLFFRHRDRCC